MGISKSKYLSLQKNGSLECTDQDKVVNELRSKGYFVHSVPNHKRGKNQVSGMPDLEIKLDGGKTIHLEMKRKKNGRLSDDQILVHEKLRSMGHVVFVAYGYDDAMDQIEKLL